MQDKRHFWPLTIALAGLVSVIRGGFLIVEPGWAYWANNPPTQPGFPQILSGSGIYESSPTVADLDGDATSLEIVLAGRDQTDGVPNCKGRVYAYRVDGSTYWERQVRAPINSTPAVADIDGDGKAEVLVGLGGYVDTQCWHGGLLAMDGRTGDTQWLFDTQDWLYHQPDGWLDGVYSSPAVGDVDNDGDLEVVFGAWDQCIYMLDGATGAPIWPELNAIADQSHCGRHGFYNEDTVWSSPALADLDNNGTLEIIIGADITAGNQNHDPTGGYVYVLRHDGTLLAREWLDQAIYSSPAVGDLDNDGQVEIVVGTGTYVVGTGYYVKVFNYVPSAGGETDRLVQKYHLSTSGRVFSSPALADLNGDGVLDVVVTANVGDGPEQGGADNGTRVVAWNGQTGAKMFERLICDSFGNHFVTHSSPIVAEVGRSGDTGLKILFSHSWEVGVLNANGTYYTDVGPCASDETTDLTYWTNYGVFGAPAAGDIDSDGKVEVVIGGTYGTDNPNLGMLYVWEPGRAAGEFPWPQFRHDAQNTGNFCFTVSAPTNPTDFVTSPGAGVWPNDNIISVSWSGASTFSACGMLGYSVTWTQDPDSVPDATLDTFDANTISPILGEGEWYFHLRTRDMWGNWAADTVHLGPFRIDAQAPAPASVTYLPECTIGSIVSVR